MTIFTVLLPSPQPRVVERIKAVYPNDHLALNETQYLISATGTVIAVTAKLDIYDAGRPDLASSGNAVIFATTSYFGRGPTSVWDWIKAKLEASPSG